MCTDDAHSSLFIHLHVAPCPFPSQVREFVDAALQYAEGVAIAVGPTPPSTDHRDGASDAGHSGDGQAHRPDSLLHAVSRVAREATEAHASSWHGGRYGDEEGGGRGAGKSGALVNVFMVTPWGKFVPALNALLGFAARNGADFVMFQVGLCGYSCFYFLGGGGIETRERRLEDGKSQGSRLPAK